jgi:hypothetical protein
MSYQRKTEDVTTIQFNYSEKLSDWEDISEYPHADFSSAKERRMAVKADYQEYVLSGGGLYRIITKRIRIVGR